MSKNKGTRQKTAGVYVHIPFCERKCTYCNFNTTDFFEGLARRYIVALNQEVAFWGKRLAEERKLSGDNSSGTDRIAVDTIYFGGGTPSIVESEQLASVIKTCRAAFELAEDTEITIEINPATLSRAKIEGWLAAGINRASVGVQSFIDRELVALSRTHTSADARRTVEQLREAGFDNISIDLIAGLPEQTLDDWRFNLCEALRLRPEHMSLYLLEVKEGTQLYAQLKRGERPAPDDDAAAEMYQMISDMTQAAGYEHYEISNFALMPTGKEESSSPFRSKHNVKYWTGAAFYGMGCGAHSYDGRSRWVNVMQTEKYIADVTSTGQAVSSRTELGAQDRAAEAIFMGLRLKEGISLEEFRAEYDTDVPKQYENELERLTEAGLIEIKCGRLRLTGRGRLLSNEVFVSFV
jgi:oxygen-independent coproporphyrinogen III oxidase